MSTESPLDGMVEAFARFSRHYLLRTGAIPMVDPDPRPLRDRLTDLRGVPRSRAFASKVER